MRERGPVSLAGSLPGRSRSVGCIHPCLSRGCNYAWVLGTALCLHPFRPVVKAFEKPSSVASPWGPRHPSWVSLTLTIRACFSRVQRFATSWTIACQAPLSMGFSRQECWRGLPFSSPGDLPNPGIPLASNPAHTSVNSPFMTRPSGTPAILFPPTDVSLSLLFRNGQAQRTLFTKWEEPQGLALDLDSEEEFTQRWRGHTGLASQTTPRGRRAGQPCLTALLPL